MSGAFAWKGGGRKSGPRAGENCTKGAIDFSVFGAKLPAVPN